MSSMHFRIEIERDKKRMKYTNYSNSVKEIEFYGKKKENGVLPLLQFPLLQQVEEIQHCFTTREGGVSEGMFESLNLSFNRGDKPDCVMENFKRVAEFFDTTVEHFVASDQTHTTNIKVVTKADMGKGITREADYHDIDGLITKEKGVVLSTFFADCVPIYFVDIVHHAIGLCHSGWRGTYSGICNEMIKKMRQEFDTMPRDLVCAIGPSICQNCYEVDEDVAVKFAYLLKEDAPKYMKNCGNGKYLIDLWGINQRWLVLAGVPKSQINVTNVCTCCNSDKLFSHRASKGKRGNLGAFLMLR